MTIMLLPDDKMLFLGADMSPAMLDEATKFMSEWFKDPTKHAAFARFDVQMVIDARVTPAIAINVP